MMEMHFFKRADEIELPSVEEKKEVVALDFFDLLFGISEWTQSCPLIYRCGQENEKAIDLLFRNFAFIGYDFWQTFGPYFCLVNHRWKMDVFGSSYPSQETVWLNIEQRDNCYYGVQNTVSGKEVETIHSLCLRVECDSTRQAEIIEMLLQSADWKRGILVADWKYHEFFNKEHIENHWENSCFCYGSVFEEVSSVDYLHALNFTQKVTLWTGFLQEGFDYKEFEWLYQMILERTVENRIEWELALYAAMRELKYTIQVSEHEFELYDAQLKRRYLNFNSRQYAEMAMLKILFPVNL